MLLLLVDLLSFNQSNMSIALHPPEQSSGLQLTTTSHFVPHPRPDSPEKADALVAEELQLPSQLVELAKQTFPDCRVVFELEDSRTSRARRLARL